MSVVMRMSRIGTKKKPHYRIVILDKRRPRDGRYIEEIGHYNPASNPPVVHINEERAKYWLGVGARVSETVRSLLKRKGIIK